MQSVREVPHNLLCNVDLPPGSQLVTLKKITLIDDSDFAHIVPVSLMGGTILTVSKPCDGIHFYLRSTCGGVERNFKVGLINSWLFKKYESKSVGPQSAAAPVFAGQLLPMSAEELMKTVEKLGDTTFFNFLSALENSHAAMKENARIRVHKRAIEEVGNEHNSMLCPIGLHIFKDPVVAADGILIANTRCAMNKKSQCEYEMSY